MPFLPGCGHWIGPDQTVDDIPADGFPCEHDQYRGEREKRPAPILKDQGEALCRRC